MLHNIIFAIIVVDAALLILIFRLYRVKEKAGEVLQHQRDEIAGRNIALEKVIQEKEWFLMEVHHRVKNNLHMISGLLTMQANRLEDNTARTAIMDSQNRVQAISMIHQKLSWDNDVSLVDFSSYLGDLINHLKDSYDTTRICFEVWAEPILIDTRTAISLGLVINEAVTNAIKYAFPPARSGTVIVTLHHVTADLWKLIIQDDGVGMPAGTERQPKSIGLSLIEGIAEELDGDIRVDSTHGFLVEIIFPYEESKIPMERVPSPVRHRPAC